MRISDWSSDVCSSDLHGALSLRRPGGVAGYAPPCTFFPRSWRGNGCESCMAVVRSRIRAFRCHTWIAAAWKQDTHNRKYAGVESRGRNESIRFRVRAGGCARDCLSVLRRSSARPAIQLLPALAWRREEGGPAVLRLPDAIPPNLWPGGASCAAGPLFWRCPMTFRDLRAAAIIVIGLVGSACP